MQHINAIKAHIKSFLKKSFLIFSRAISRHGSKLIAMGMQDLA
jgi:hypothetical protein